jgi:hypothetical protein
MCPVQTFVQMARPERFELPTSWFVAMHSIQLSYGRVLLDRQDSLQAILARAGPFGRPDSRLAEREGFEPSMSFWPILP